jgi:hypothetical protein
MRGEAALVHVTVLGSGGEAVANARVFFESGPAELPDVAALSDEQGRVAIGVPRAGRYRIVCAAEGYRTARRDIEVSAPQGCSLTVGLARD